jgi:hypothetical protein
MGKSVTWGIYILIRLHKMAGRGNPQLYARVSWPTSILILYSYISLGQRKENIPSVKRKRHKVCSLFLVSSFPSLLDHIFSASLCLSRYFCNSCAEVYFKQQSRDLVHPVSTTSTRQRHTIRSTTAVVLKHFTSEPPLTRENTLRRPPACFFIKIEVMICLTFYSVYFVSI